MEEVEARAKCFVLCCVVLRRAVSCLVVSCREGSAVIKQDGCHFLSLNEIDVKTGVNTHILTFTARYG